MRASSNLVARLGGVAAVVGGVLWSAKAFHDRNDAPAGRPTQRTPCSSLCRCTSWSDGSALVIHADEDDQMTDPTGNSGARIICGVIHKAQ